MTTLQPKLTINNQITHDLTQIERARGFLDAATLSGEWIGRMSQRALLLEAHHTTHIEGTRLTLEESARLLAGENVPGADPDDARELLYKNMGSWALNNWKHSARVSPDGPCSET